MRGALIRAVCQDVSRALRSSQAYVGHVALQAGRIYDRPCMNYSDRKNDYCYETLEFVNRIFVLTTFLSNITSAVSAQLL